MRSSVHIPKLQASDWQYFPTRPNNFPTLRISAANILISRFLNEDLFRTIIQTLKSVDNSEGTRRTLARLLSVPLDPFWLNHYDFDQVTRNPMVALGLSRINDLLVNTVVPIALLYARIFKDTQVREHTLHFYESFPRTDDNTITRLMQKQLLHNKVLLDGASRQQGIIQLYKFYCTEDRCDDCEVGRNVFHPD